jgi:hypothetical protein
MLNEQSAQLPFRHQLAMIVSVILLVATRLPGDTEKGCQGDSYRIITYIGPFH